MKNSPEKIGEMLREIGDYQELSLNLDQDWRLDADEASGWLEDLWRVLDEPKPEPETVVACAVPAPSFDEALATSVSLPPRYMVTAWQAQDQGSSMLRILAGESLPVRLAVYLKMLGPADDTYPDEWLDPATGELPTMQQLAVLDQVSLPTLRKRRDAAIAVLQGTAR